MKLIIGLSLALALNAGFVRGESEARPDLTGRVIHEDGSPVAKATVFIYTAGPKKGTASVCPSCYVDCRKKAQTDAEGNFRIESLDPTLLFRLLVVAGGHESQFVTKVDPAKGEQPVTAKLMDPETIKTRAHISGVVIGPDGKAVVGATIGPEGVERVTGTQWGGTDSFVDPAAVTDERGHFVLFCTKDVLTVHAVAEGINVSKRWVALKPGNDHLIRMQEGVAVTGSVEREGKPIKDALVGLVTVDRICGNYFRCDELATDKDGRFLLSNVPADREFVLYATMDSLGKRGALTPKMLTTGKTGTTFDVGKLSVQPGHHLSGRLILSDKTPIPSGTRLLLGREQAWDHTEALLDSDGHFEFNNIPAEAIGLSMRIKGYKFSKKNPNLDWLNGGIVGRVTGDLDDLILLMEPGDWRYNGDEGQPPGGNRQPRDEPLRSAKMLTAAASAAPK